MKIPTEIMQETEKIADEFMELNHRKLSWLTELHFYLSQHKTRHENIGDKILPLFYKLGIFVGSTSFSHWQTGFEWAESEETEDKYQKLDLKTTLALLTATLERREAYGADYWYSKGITQKLIARLVEFRENEPKPKSFEFVKTGFTNLDAVIGGLRKSGITAIGSRPAMGLCRFQHNVISSMVEKSQPVLYLSLEDHKAVFIRENGRNRKLAKITEDISPAITGLETIIFNELNENKFEVVVIDYISSCDKHKFNTMLNELQDIAEKFNLAIIFGTGLARYDCQSNKSSPRPTLADFAFSKILLDCIDTVVALHRPAYYYTEDEMEYGKSYGSETELIVLKAANGKTSIVEIKFDIDALKFTD